MPSADLDAYAHDAVVRDGRTVHIRPVRPDDAEDLLEMWQRLSPETVRRRFFAPRRMDREQIRYFSDVDYDRRFVFVAETGGRIVGLSQFDRLGDGSTAEFAVIVEDAEQGRGIGTALLRALVAPAEDQGVTGFVGDVLAENTPMLRMLRDAGLQPVVTTSGPVVHTTFPSTPTEAFLSSVDEQDRKAAVAALSAVLTPMSIAVVGASRDPTSIGGLVFGNLLRGRFAGPVYPVNPAADHVQSVAAYTSVADCPTVPELIVVCVPAAGVAEVVDEAARLGTKAAVIISAGFSDAGPEGAELERQLMEVVRSYGLRVVGPNSMGVVNAGADLRMNATFSAAFPAPGRVAFCSHSGALGLAVLSTASRLGLGISSFASVGNRSDISGNDLLQYWESDSETDLVLLYLESFGNPRKFGRIARRIGRRKPIVAVKAGRSELGGVTASGDPAAAAAGDVAVEALFRQAGVIRTDTLEQMFNVASVLANQPVPRGNRVAVLANGGGPGVLAADACRSQGLRVPALASRAVERLRELLVGEGDIGQPVILSSSAPAEHYGRAMRILAADSNVDALLVLFIPPAVTEPDEIAREMAAVRRDVDPDIPIVSVFMSERGLPAALAEARIPSFGFPEDAAEVLGHLARYGLWRSKPLGNVVKVDDADADAAHAVVEDALREPAPGVQEWWLDAVRTDRLLSAFGITTAPRWSCTAPTKPPKHSSSSACRWRSRAPRRCARRSWVGCVWA